jgi:hypothetical protein
MVVNGDVAYATLYSLSQYTIVGVDSQDGCHFPIYGQAGRHGPADEDLRLRKPSDRLPVLWNSWQVVNITNSAETAVWKFNVILTSPPRRGVRSRPGQGQHHDRTLSFDDIDSETSIPARENNHDWRVTTVNPTESAVVGLLRVDAGDQHRADR